MLIYIDNILTKLPALSELWIWKSVLLLNPNIAIHFYNLLTLIWNEIHLFEITKGSTMSWSFKHFSNTWIRHTIPTKPLGIPFCSELISFQDMTTHYLDTIQQTNYCKQTVLFFEAAAISIVCNECKQRLKIWRDIIFLFGTLSIVYSNCNIFWFLKIK